MSLDARDWQTMKEAGANAPLDPDSAEARQLESSLATLTSANLASSPRAGAEPDSDVP